MTDEQIIKALECCGNWESDKSCDECPENTYGFGCAQKMAKHSLDLINRQKAENEDLKKAIETMTNKDLRLAIDFKARIDKLKAENLELLDMCAKQGEEAIKEFADKFKQTFDKAINGMPKGAKGYSLRGDILHDTHLIIDHVKKEMVGDSDA